MLVAFDTDARGLSEQARTVYFFAPIKNLDSAEAWGENWEKDGVERNRLTVFLDFCECARLPP